MLHKIGTVKELEKVKRKIPSDVFRKILEIVTILDREYGADRNIDENDGGFVLFADDEAGIAEAEKFVDIQKRTPEIVEQVVTEYVNTLYVKTNEFTINLISKKTVTPKKLTDELDL
jgi:hypothetical protein